MNGLVQDSGSEDCLVLNVFVPGNVTVGAKLPVLSQIHGGGYTEGDGALGSLYGLMRHSDDEFVWVSIQYRLGAYGFMGGERYLEDGGVQNVGLLDQRFALEWMQKHIRAFGGDRKKLTILGGSVGGGSVTAMMIWEGGVENPPFRAAIADFPFWQQYRRKEQLDTQFGYLLEASNCFDLARLQEVPEDILRNATQATYARGYAEGDYGYGNFYFGPYVDGTFIRGLPSREFIAGNFAKVPTWISREGYEGVTFSSSSMMTVEEEKADLGMQFPYAYEGFIDKLYELYPSEEYNSTFFHRAAWFGDFVINCPTYYIGASIANSDTPVFKEVFSAGAQTHGSTGPFFDPYYAPGVNATLGGSMKDWYISFAINLDPNAQSWRNVSKPTWPDYHTGEVMSLHDSDIGAVRDTYYDNTARCQFFGDDSEVEQN